VFQQLANALTCSAITQIVAVLELWCPMCVSTHIFFIDAASHASQIDPMVQRRTARSCDDACTTMLGFGQQDFLTAFRSRVQCAAQVGE